MGAKLVHAPFKGAGFSLNARFTGEVQTVIRQREIAKWGKVRRDAHIVAQ